MMHDAIVKRIDATKLEDFQEMTCILSMFNKVMIGQELDFLAFCNNKFSGYTHYKKVEEDVHFLSHFQVLYNLHECRL